MPAERMSGEFAGQRVEFCSGERVCELRWGGGGRWKMAAEPREGRVIARDNGWQTRRLTGSAQPTYITSPGGEITSACTTTVFLPRGTFPASSPLPVHQSVAPPPGRSPRLVLQASRSFSSLATHYTRATDTMMKRMSGSFLHRRHVGQGHELFAR